MNTPRKLKRYAMDIPSFSSRQGGAYSTGLTNDDYAVALADITTHWSHLEEGMIVFFALLLGHPGPSSPARQIYRSIIAPNARIKMLKAVLEKSAINRDKTAEYDAVINEFELLNRERNTYVHGLWDTHDESGKAFLCEPSPDAFYFLHPRHVPIEELQNIVIRMGNLARRIICLEHPPLAQGMVFKPLLDVPDGSNDR
jgi:hypothetical protein